MCCSATTGCQEYAAAWHVSATACSRAVLPEPPGPSTPTTVPPASPSQRSNVDTSCCPDEPHVLGQRPIGRQRTVDDFRPEPLAKGADGRTAVAVERRLVG